MGKRYMQGRVALLDQWTVSRTYLLKSCPVSATFAGRMWTQTQHYHAHYQATGEGRRLYEGRFKSSPARRKQPCRETKPTEASFMELLSSYPPRQGCPMGPKLT